ncbi:cobalt-precorrin-5B (C(1))-methyltransferase [Denitrobaculum tricleocarpae]|uniref:Cobalt-precorrin-5B C(1)-methyltransferase n=1 Tax=Denitrobaculum tricleocarpae TaxID=2591009 RepID=A0A545TMG3_9PROT|nr:cobalt-precorrin-5B (C(1))-methyltransferase [Denitrobaculum tricleocarpae]TQV78427.1 cobalt-precorrin-5B (C(1))-methyltransferase [Denitrobaculum tricleocarpae]
MVRKPQGELRRGWTTGACATAATCAAYTALLTGEFPDPVTITLPRGEQPAFALNRQEITANYARAGIIKDAGDDPDVTHLAEIIVTLRRGEAGTGVRFQAGEGVGTVTKPGLPIPVGEASINPVPRRMMTETVQELSERYGDSGDVEIEISVPGGAALAKKTWNPRLGILGGLSILGTTGIVVPFSCSAWIHSIHRGIDVARANGLTHVAGCTGSTSEKAVQTLHSLPDFAMLDMGDFAGGLLKYLRKHPIPLLTIGGGFAKLTKLAAGHLDLHSGRSQVDFDWLTGKLADLGAPESLIASARTANTANQVLEAARQEGVPLADAIARGAQKAALGLLAGETEIEVLVFDRAGQLVGSANAR